TPAGARQVAQAVPGGAVGARRDDAGRGAGLGVLVRALRDLVGLVAVVAAAVVRLRLGTHGPGRLPSLGGESSERTDPEGAAVAAGRGARGYREESGGRGDGTDREPSSSVGWCLHQILPNGHRQAVGTDPI